MELLANKWQKSHANVEICYICYEKLESKNELKY